MEDDSEVLDWGNEDDEQHVSERTRRGTPTFHDAHHQSLAGSGDADDAEDAVSLGGDDDEPQELSSFDARREPVTANASSASLVRTRSVERSQPQQLVETQQVSPRQRRRSGSPPQETHSRANSVSTVQSPQRALIHALPPKPLAASVPFLPPSHPSIIEATAMSRSREKTKSNGASPTKPLSSADIPADPPLPADWEVRYPRNGGRGQYYYNTRTHESTWTRPGSTSVPVADNALGHGNGYPEASNPSRSITARDEQPSGRRSPPPVRLFDSYRPGISSPPRPSRVADLPAAGPLSYEDRHYRPGENNSVPPADLRDGVSQAPAPNTHPLPPRHVSRSSHSPPRPHDNLNSRGTGARQMRPQRSGRKSDARDDSSDRHWVASDHWVAPDARAASSVSTSAEHAIRPEQPPLNDRRGPRPEPRSGRPSQAHLDRHDNHKQSQQQPAYNDSLSASAPPRTRSSPPPVRDHEPTLEPKISAPLRTPTTSSALPPEVQGNRGDRPSRFDRPDVVPSDNFGHKSTSPVLQRASYPEPSQVGDTYAPLDNIGNGSVRGRDRDDAPSSSRPSEARIDRQPQSQYPPRDGHDAPSIYPPRGLPPDDARASPPPDTTRRVRAPLPPQNTQFRQEIRKKPVASAEIPAPPSMPRERVERSAPALPPSGPRSRDPPPPPFPRDRDGYNDMNRRPPPPSNNVDRRPDMDRRGPVKDVDMDVDGDRYSRGRMSVPNDVIARATSGSTGDGNPNAGNDVPKGPRAMVTPNMSQGPPRSPPPHYGGPSSAPWGSRDRSPPPRRDQFDDRDRDRYPRGPGPGMDSGRRVEEYPVRQANDVHVHPNAYPDPHSRREPREPRRGRRDGPVSGTNNIPIANNRFASASGSSSSTPAPRMVEPSPIGDRPSGYHEPMAVDAPSNQARQAGYVDDARSGRDTPVSRDGAGYMNDRPGYDYELRQLPNHMSQDDAPVSVLMQDGGNKMAVPINHQSRPTSNLPARPLPLSDHSPLLHNNSQGTLSQEDDFRPSTPPPQSRAPSQTSTGWPASQERSRSRDPAPRAKVSRFSAPVDTPAIPQSWPSSQEAPRQEPPRQDQFRQAPPRQGPSRFDNSPQEPPRQAQEQPRGEVWPPPQGGRRESYDGNDGYRGGSLQGRLGERYPEAQAEPMSRRPHSPEILPNSMRRRDPPPHSNYYRPSDAMGRDPSPPRQGGGGRGRPPPDWQPPRKEFSDPPRDTRDLPPPRSYPEANLPPRPPSSSRDEPPRSWDYEMRPPESFPPRPQAKRSTGSLLDRISHDVLPVDEPPSSASTSLKDRVQLPSKRDRDESLAREKGRNGHGHVNGPESYERPMEYEDVQENEGAAKRRRKNGKARRGRRGGGGGVQS